MHLKEFREIIIRHFSGLRSTLNEEVENFDKGTKEGKEKFEQLIEEDPLCKSEFRQKQEQFLEEREQLRISLMKHKEKYDLLVLESYKQFQIANPGNDRRFTKVHKVRLIEIGMVVCIELNDTDR